MYVYVCVLGEGGGEIVRDSFRLKLTGFRRNKNLTTAPGIFLFTLRGWSQLYYTLRVPAGGKFFVVFFLIEARRALEIVRTKSIYMSTTRNQYLKFENFATLLLLLSRNSCKVANFEGCMAV